MIRHLSLKSEAGGGNAIYYTLDGSEPNMNDYKYDKKAPILITDATANDNIYAARTDTSAAFLSDFVDMYSRSNPHYTVPDYNVDKCNIIRASVFDKEGNCFDSITGVYFVGFQNRSGYQGIYTASIVTDPDNLFDFDNGIYTTGSAFESYKNEILLQSDRQDDWSRDYWWLWYSNYHERGINWEREAVVTVFDDNRRQILSEECGIRVQGGGSRGRLPKSIGCYARKEYSGKRKFSSDLFYLGVSPHKFVFFSGGDDNVFKLKDCMVNTMGEELWFSTMDFIPCAVFLDGEYWGIYYITENYNSDYISDHYRVNRDNVILIKNGEMSEGYEEDKDLFSDVRNFISENDMMLEENYLKACELIDIDSYIDYYAAQIYIGRCNDWPSGNWAAWRTREWDGSAYGDCRWRWMLFDVNSGGISGSLENTDTLSEVIQADEMFYSLYLNDTFRAEFAERILYIGREIFSKDKCEDFLYEWEVRMEDSLAASNRRFYNDTKSEELNLYIEDIRRFFDGRYDAVWIILENNMGEEWLKQKGIQR